MHESISIDVWLLWEPPSQGNAARWQRIFDFGSNPAEEGSQGDGIDTHLFLSPRTSGVSGALHLSYRGNGTGSLTLNAPNPLPANTLQHVTVVVDGPGRQMAIYQEGVLSVSRVMTEPLSKIEDQNNWLGRSQTVNDPAFQGQIFEFRIYNRVLAAEDVRLSDQGGPDIFLDSGG